MNYDRYVALLKKWAVIIGGATAAILFFVEKYENVFPTKAEPKPTQPEDVAFEEIQP